MARKVPMHLVMKGMRCWMSSNLRLVVRTGNAMEQLALDLLQGV